MNYKHCNMMFDSLNETSRCTDSSAKLPGFSKYILEKHLENLYKTLFVDSILTDPVSFALH